MATILGSCPQCGGPVTRPELSGSVPCCQQCYTVVPELARLVRPLVPQGIQEQYEKALHARQELRRRD